MEIKKDFKNSLFKRQEISGELESEKNPSFDEVRRFISEKIKKPEETIEVRNVKGSFGKHIFYVDAHVYESKEDLNKMKQLTKTKKQRTEETKKAKEEAAKPKEEITETPIEDKPEEESKKEIEEEQKAEEN